MTTIEKKERGTTVKTTWNTKSDGADADVNSPKINIYKPDGTKLVDDDDPTHDGTGNYSYHFTTTSSDLLGLYVIEWTGYHDVSGTAKPIIDRKLVEIVSVSQ